MTAYDSQSAKPIIFDMSARIQAKQDYIDMLEEENENEW